MSDTSTCMLEEIEALGTGCGRPRDGEGNEGLPPRSRLNGFVLDVETTIRHPESLQSMIQWVEQVILYMYPRREIATRQWEKWAQRLGKVVANASGEGSKWVWQEGKRSQTAPSNKRSSEAHESAKENKENWFKEEWKSKRIRRGIK